MTILKVTHNDENQTIFNYIKKNFKQTSLSVIYKWFRTNKIKINDKRIKDQKIVLKAGDEVKVYDSASAVKRVDSTVVDFSDLKVIYEDENILIADKPANLEIHSPINENLDAKVRSYLISSKQYDPELETSFVISHVHRLDKLTSGLVIYAKNKATLDVLLEAIKNKENIEKYYMAQLEDNLVPEGLIEGYIDYNPESQLADFRLEEKKRYKECSQIHKWYDKKDNILEIQLLSGRKHQIRAIMMYYNCPIVDDFRYGGQRNQNKSIALVAYKLIFRNFSNHLEYLNDREFVSTNSF
ncbi:23S rRNA pseudouridine955/2504/2580 synthase [Spiroplasma chinense]|uniref:RNA pseudouridylate synthase n=1 Tax=Spiroplasma chinense TaxID=216932 RepID=A0A5B9Y5P7_9MOLU|nr:RluA family pseudouridine synthase [Spiroplasma chinense]QEH61352.1 23S rRNA pseudouridine955/2504/2580 synthase [Spiroplasma chinense]